jgi:hypothetical protein
MSSTPFSIELTPELRLRRIVLASGAALGGAGVLVMMTLPVAAHWRWLGASLWGLVGLREILIIASGYRRYRRIRIDSSGALELLRTQGGWMSAELLAGSVVLQNLAWLRFRLPGGLPCAELLQGNMRENESWRRFQLIWRHLGGPR